MNELERAREVASRDLSRCTREILQWRKTGRLPDDALLHEVAAVLPEQHDSLQQAEHVVVLLALGQVAGDEARHSYITARYRTFYFALGDVRADLNEDDLEAASERLYPVWTAAHDLIEQRQQRHGRRTYVDAHGVELVRWEYCDQLAETEVRKGKVVWPVQFQFAEAPSDEDVAALRELCAAAFKEVCDAAGIEFAYVDSEVTEMRQVVQRRASA